MDEEERGVVKATISFDYKTFGQEDDRDDKDIRMPPCSWRTKLRSHSKMETSYCCFDRTSEEP